MSFSFAGLGLDFTEPTPLLFLVCHFNGFGSSFSNGYPQWVVEVSFISDFIISVHFVILAHYYLVKLKLAVVGMV